MKWDLPERVEESVAKYLRSAIPGSIRVYESWGFDAPQYPCVVVFASDDNPVSDLAAWNEFRAMNVRCAVMVEATPEKQGTTTIRTARERNAEARSAVIEALAVTADPAQDANGQPLGLPKLLNDAGVAGLVFSMAQLTTMERTVEDRKLVSILNLEVIAAPVAA